MPAEQKPHMFRDCSLSCSIAAIAIRYFPLGTSDLLAKCFLPTRALATLDHLAPAILYCPPGICFRGFIGRGSKGDRKAMCSATQRRVSASPCFTAARSVVGWGAVSKLCHLWDPLVSQFQRRLYHSKRQCRGLALTWTSPLRQDPCAPDVLMTVANGARGSACKSWSASFAKSW